MINEVYAIRDDASECFLQFFCFNNEKLADMTIRKLFKERKLNIPLLYDYPNTYRVFKIATYDDNSGLFENVAQKLLLDFGSIVPSETGA